MVVSMFKLGFLFVFLLSLNSLIVCVLYLWVVVNIVIVDVWVFPPNITLIITLKIKYNLKKWLLGIDPETYVVNPLTLIIYMI